MARKINIEFNDTTYTIEYNRESVVKLMGSLKDEDSELEQAIVIIYYGLWKHHKNNMPDMDDVYGWVIAMGEGQLKDFVEALRVSIQEVIETVKSEQKQGNFKWEVVK